MAAARVFLMHLDSDQSRSMTHVAGPPPTAGEVMEGVSSELRVHGHRAESVELATRAVEWYRSRPADIAASQANRIGLARAVYLTERWEEADALGSEHPFELLSLAAAGVQA